MEFCKKPLSALCLPLCQPVEVAEGTALRTRRYAVLGRQMIRNMTSEQRQKAREDIRVRRHEFPLTGKAFVARGDEVLQPALCTTTPRPLLSETIPIHRGLALAAVDVLDTLGVPQKDPAFLKKRAPMLQKILDCDLITGAWPSRLLGGN